MIEIRTGKWEEVLEGVTCQAVIFDPPYGAKTHDSEPTRRNEKEGANGRKVIAPKAEGYSTAGLTPDYEAWTPELVDACVRSWSPRCFGWMVALTSHDLIPSWEAAYDAADRYVFHPIPCVIRAMSVRLCGDGPSSEAIYAMVARPRNREYATWGTLPGAYVVPRSRDSKSGRGKPPWLMNALVRDYSRKGDLIVDPCAGWGATLAAAESLGRSAIGAEVAPEVADEARRLLAKPRQIDMFT